MFSTAICHKRSSDPFQLHGRPAAIAASSSLEQVTYPLPLSRTNTGKSQNYSSNGSSSHDSNVFITPHVNPTNKQFKINGVVPNDKLVYSPLEV